MAGEQALDFSHDSGDTSLLDMLGQQLGQVEQQSSQAANMDEQAAQAGVPAPTGQVPGPPPVDQMGPPAPPLVGGGVAVPPTDNTIPQAAPGPGPQVQNVSAGPSPTLNPDAPARLRPEPQAQEVQTDAQRGETEMRAAEHNQELALAEKAQADNDFAKEAQPVFDYEARVAKDKVDATQAVQNWLTVQQNQIAANTQSDLQRQEALAQEHPTDWWGNRSTPQKLRALVGMLGTSMTGRQASGYVDNLINQDVADYNRRSSALAAIRGIHGEQERQFRNSFRDAGTMIDTMAISRYQQATKMLQAKRNQSSSKIVQANYDGAIAELQTKIADDIEKLNNKKLTNLAEQQRFALQWAQLAQRDREMQARATGAEQDDSVYMDDVEQTGAGTMQGVDKRVIAKVKPAHDLFVSGIESLNQIQDNFQAMDRGEQSVADTASKVAPLISDTQAVARELAHAGARLEGKEQGLIDAMSTGWQDFIKGKITGVQMSEKINAVRSMIARKAAQITTSNTKGLRMKKDSTIGRVIEDDRQREEASTLERAILQQQLAAAKTPEQQDLVLQKLAKGGNKAAKLKYQAKHQHLWNRWLGGGEAAPE